MNISKLLHVTILVADLDKARNFYEKILGLTPVASRPQMSFVGVWYDLGPQQLHLMQLPNPEAGLQISREIVYA